MERLSIHKPSLEMVNNLARDARDLGIFGFLLGLIAKLEITNMPPPPGGSVLSNIIFLGSGVAAVGGMLTARVSGRIIRRNREAGGS